MSDALTPAATGEAQRRIYERRFQRTADYRNRVWQVLTRHFFAKWIPKDATVLDLGCGYGEFISHIEAGTKLAMDLNPDSAGHLHPNVLLFQQDCSEPWPVSPDCLDVVFSSNFFEHLPDKAALLRTLGQAHRALKPGARLIAVGPNVRVLPGSYWDFFDHHLPLTEKSLAEALELAGFTMESAVARFLPYTVQGGPQYPLVFLRWYLALPVLWSLFGTQFLVVARKTYP